MALRIGNLTLETSLLLAPLAGWTTPAFRQVVREIGGVGLATTEVIAVKSLLGASRRTESELLRVAPADRPLAAQVNPTTPEQARDAARALEARGFDAVDLNLGCPVRKIAGKGGGAALARDCVRAAAVARAAIAAVAIPVTAKMRLGWEPGELTAPDLARALADAGVAAVAVHGRTRAQGFSGRVDLAGIRAVVEAVRPSGAAPPLPVIGNGDVRTAADARRMIEETGCAGVQIGRAALTNPWIFREAEALLAGRPAPAPPPLAARLEACERHFRLLAADLPERVAAHRFRKVLRAWGAALGAGERFRADAARIDGLADLRALLAALRQARGEDREAGAPRDEQVVAVPSGPVDLW